MMDNSRKPQYEILKLFILIIIAVIDIHGQTFDCFDKGCELKLIFPQRVVRGWIGVG